MKIILLCILAVAMIGLMVPSVNAVHTVEHQANMQNFIDRCNDYPSSCDENKKFKMILELQAMAEKERLEKMTPSEIVYDHDQRLLEGCHDDPHSCDWREYSEILEERMKAHVKAIEKQKAEEEILFKGVLWVVVILLFAFLGFIVVAVIVNRRSKYYNYYKK